MGFSMTKSSAGGRFWGTPMTNYAWLWMGIFWIWKISTEEIGKSFCK